MDSLRGQLLLASPALQDPNFLRTVVLVAEHNEEGAMGLVLNRPSPAEVGEAAPEIGAVVEPGGVVHVGGPVQPLAITILAEFDDPDDAALIVFDSIGFVRAERETDPLDVSIRRARVFAGYAGWGAGQLEAELEREDWIVAPALAGEVFTDDADGLWAAALERMGGRFALLAR